MKLKDLATIERAKSGKVYEKGCILIQVSATKGQVYYHSGGEVKSQYAVVKLLPGIRLDPKFLYLYLVHIFGIKLEAIKSGLNIQVSDLNNLSVEF